METATLGILLTMTDDASPKMEGFTSTLTSSRAALRELGAGLHYLGSTFLSLGLAMKSSNDVGLQSIGNMVLFAGSIMTAVASSVQFISAVAKMVNALKTLALWETIVKAFQGPAGWAMIVGGAAVAGGAIAYSRSKSGEGNVTNNMYIQGSVVTERQLSDTVRQNIIVNQQRNNKSGIR